MALRLYSAMLFSWEVAGGVEGGIKLWQSTDWKELEKKSNNPTCLCAFVAIGD